MLCSLCLVRDQSVGNLCSLGSSEEGKHLEGLERLAVRPQPSACEHRAINRRCCSLLVVPGFDMTFELEVVMVLKMVMGSIVRQPCATPAILREFVAQGTI